MLLKPPILLRPTLFSKEDGSLWGMGVNGSNGMLGTGDTNNSLVPKKIMDGGIAQLAAGNQNILIRKSDGSIWATGSNSSGQLGTGDTNSSLTPTKIWPREIAWTEQILKDQNGTFVVPSAWSFIFDGDAIIFDSGPIFKRNQNGSFVFDYNQSTEFAEQSPLLGLSINTDYLTVGGKLYKRNGGTFQRLLSLKEEIPNYYYDAVTPLASWTSLQEGKILTGKVTDSGDNYIRCFRINSQNGLDLMWEQFLDSDKNSYSGATISNGRMMLSKTKKHILYKLDTQVGLQKVNSIAHPWEGGPPSMFTPTLKGNLFARTLYNESGDFIVKVYSIDDNNNFQLLEELHSDHESTSDWSAGSLFGFSIDISDKWLVIGDPSAVGGGAVYVYRIIGGDKFKRVTKLVSGAPELQNYSIGGVVRVFGNTVVTFGSPIFSSDEGSKVHVFELKE